MSKKVAKKTTKVGRKTKYLKKYNDQAYKLCLLGAIDKEIASFFEVSVATINNWKKEHPQFLESIKAGKLLADMEVAESLYNTTKDRMIPTQQAFKVKSISYVKGKRVEKETIEVVEVMTSVPANERAIQFWLKNRRPDQWRDSKVIEGNDEKPLAVKQITGMEIL